MCRKKGGGGKEGGRERRKERREKENDKSATYQLGNLGEELTVILVLFLQFLFKSEIMSK